MRSWIYVAIFVFAGVINSKQARAQNNLGGSGSGTLHPSSFTTCYLNRSTKVLTNHNNTSQDGGDPLAWLYLVGQSRTMVDSFSTTIDGKTTTGNAPRTLNGFSQYCQNMASYTCKGVNEAVSCIESFKDQLKDERDACFTKVENKINACADGSQTRAQCKNKFNKDYLCGIELARLAKYDDELASDRPLGCYKKADLCSDSSQNVDSSGGTGGGGLDDGGSSGTGIDGSGGSNGGSDPEDGGSSPPTSSASQVPQSSTPIGTSSLSNNKISIQTVLGGQSTTINARTLSGNVSIDSQGRVVVSRGSYGDRRAVDRTLKQNAAQVALKAKRDAASPVRSPAVEEPPLAQCEPSLSPSRANRLTAVDPADPSPGIISINLLKGFMGADTLHLAGVLHVLKDRNASYLSPKEASFAHVRFDLENHTKTLVIIACGQFDRVHIGGSSNLRIVDSVNADGVSVLSIENIAQCYPYGGLLAGENLKYAVVRVEAYGDPSTFSRSIVLSGLADPQRLVCRQNVNILRTKQAFSDYLDQNFPLPK